MTMQQPYFAQRRFASDLKTWLVLFTVVLGVATTDVSSADNFINISAGVRQDNNISRGFLDRDQLSDESLGLDATAGYVTPLKPGRSIVAFTALSASRFNKLRGFDNGSIGFGGRYLHKYGLGAYAPTIATTLSWTWHDSHGKTRDRHVTSMELGFGKRLSPSLATRFGARYDISEGINDDRFNASIYSTLNDIFDFDQFGIFAGVDYSFENYTTLSLNYSWVDGNTVSSALAPNPRLLGIASALTLDPAVQAPPGRHQVAYTLKTDAHLLSLNWSIPVGDDTSFNLGFARHDIRARDNVNYANNQFSVTLVHVR